MGWWSIGHGEIVGDGPADVSAAMFGRLASLRRDAQKPPLRYEDLLLILTAAAGRAGREVMARPDTKFVGMTATFDDGSEIKAELADATKNAAPDEVAVLREWTKLVAAEYRGIGDQIGRKRPTMRELLDAAVFILRPVPNKFLDAGETRALRELTARYEHAEGQLSAEEVVGMIAAAFRRNERRLGLMVENGASMSPEDVVGLAADGKEVRVSCESGQGSRALVDEMCERCEAIIRLHREEQPDSYVKTLSQLDRERYQRNIDGKGLPTLEQLVEAIRVRLAAMPERYAPLKALRVETSERSSFGLPTRTIPEKFVDSRLRVRHGKFGEGFVERTFMDGDKKYEVAFDNGKRVTLLAQFLEEITGGSADKPTPPNGTASSPFPAPPAPRNYPPEPEPPATAASSSGESEPEVGAEPAATSSAAAESTDEITEPGANGASVATDVADAPSADAQAIDPSPPEAAPEG